MKIKIYFRKFYQVLALNGDYVRFLGKRKTVYFFVIALITSFLNSFNYVALIPLVSFVIDGNSKEMTGPFASLIHLLPKNNLAFPAYWFGVLIILTFLFKIAMNVLFAHLSGKLNEGYMFSVRRRIIDTMLSDYYHSGKHSSSQALHFNNMVSRIGSFNWASFSLVSKIFSAIFLFGSLLLIEVKLALFSILFIAVWAFVLMPVLKFTRQIAADYTNVLKKVQMFLSDEIEAKEVIRIFGLSHDRELKMISLQKDAVRGNAYLSDIRVLVLNLQEFVVVVAGVIILCVAYKYKLEIGYIIAYGYVFSKFINNMNEASSYLNNALEVMPPTEEILSYIRNGAGDSVLESKSIDIQSVEFRDIDFHWGREHLFKFDSLKLKRGDKVLIRGKNGEGKSTLLRIMCGLIRSDGKFIINDEISRPIFEMPEIQASFSYLPQTGVVFEGLLCENILLNSGKSIEDIKGLSDKLQIDLNHYFSGWEKFYIQEGGNNLSGGEMQLVAVFRALIRDFEILFIDEFSNHLSQKIVCQIDDYLASINGKIIVCVSHDDFKFYNKQILVESGTVTIS